MRSMNLVAITCLILVWISVIFFYFVINISLKNDAKLRFASVFKKYFVETIENI